MIQFENLSQEAPYLIFKDKYNDSIKANQSHIEAVCIASFSSKEKEVNARFVNLNLLIIRNLFFSQIINHRNHKILTRIHKSLL